METAPEPYELAFDAYTICSFVPDLRTAHALPLAVIGHRDGSEPTFVWLVPEQGIDPEPHTRDPYYARLLREPHDYLRRKLGKYVNETGCVRRGIERLIECHQEHLAFTEFRECNGKPLTHPVEFALVNP